MTGEVSLRGGVMPIGGSAGETDGCTAGRHAGLFLFRMKTVEDLEDVADEVKEDLTIIPVKRIEEVLQKTNLI